MLFLPVDLLIVLSKVLSTWQLRSSLKFVVDVDLILHKCHQLVFNVIHQECIYMQINAISLIQSILSLPIFLLRNLRLEKSKMWEKVFGLNPCHSLLLATTLLYALFAFSLSVFTCSINDPLALLVKITPRYLKILSSSMLMLPIDYVFEVGFLVLLVCQKLVL